MNDKNDKASSKPIPPGKQAYWLINCFAEGKLNYYCKAAKHLKISEKKSECCVMTMKDHILQEHICKPQWIHRHG